jgi:hypothetical protein
MKLFGKVWQCNNTCGKDCCSELFLPMDKLSKASFDAHGSWIVSPNYADFEWLSYHKSLTIEKLPSGNRKITFSKNVPYKYVYNPYRKMDEIHIIDKCDKLLNDGKCKIFRARPQICKVADCPVFSNKAEIIHYGKNGLLKEQHEKYLKGELKKYGE